MEERRSIETKALSVEFGLLKGVKENFNASCNKHHVFVPRIKLNHWLKASVTHLQTSQIRSTSDTRNYKAVRNTR